MLTVGQAPSWFTRLATLGQVLSIPPVSPLQARAGSVGAEGVASYRQLPSWECQELLKQTQKCPWGVEGVWRGTERGDRVSGIG